MNLNNLSNCETHEQERNVVRPDYLALSISGRKLNSQNGTKQIDNVKINDNYSLHFDVDKKEITIKNVRGGENIKVEHSYLTDIQNVLNSDMPQDQKEIERAKLDWYLAEKVILSLPKGFIEKPDAVTARADVKKMGGDVAVQGANVPWSDKPIRGIVKKSDTEKKGSFTNEVADTLGGDTSHGKSASEFSSILGVVLTNEQETEIMQKLSDTLNSINDKLTNIQQTLDKNGQVQSLENKVSVSIVLEGAIKELNQVMNTIFDSYNGKITEDVTSAITEGFGKLMSKFNEVMGQIKDTISTQSKEGIDSMKKTFDIFEKSLGQLQKTMETLVASNEDLRKQNKTLQEEVENIKELLEKKANNSEASVNPVTREVPADEENTEAPADEGNPEAPVNGEKQETLVDEEKTEIPVDELKDENIPTADDFATMDGKAQAQWFMNYNPEKLKGLVIDEKLNANKKVKIIKVKKDEKDQYQITFDTEVSLIKGIRDTVSTSYIKGRLIANQMRIIGFGKVDQVTETEKKVKTEQESKPVAEDAQEAEVETVKTESENVPESQPVTTTTVTTTITTGSTDNVNENGDNNGDTAEKDADKNATVTTVTTTVNDDGDTTEKDEDTTFFNEFLKRYDNLSEGDDGFQYYICPNDPEVWGDHAGKTAKNMSVDFNEQGNIIATIYFDNEGKASICKRIIDDQNVYYTYWRDFYAHDGQGQWEKVDAEKAKSLAFIENNVCESITDENQEEFYQNLEKAQSIISTGKRDKLDTLHSSYKVYLQGLLLQDIQINNANETNIVTLLKKAEQYELTEMYSYKVLYQKYTEYVLNELKNKYQLNIGENSKNYVLIKDTYHIFDTNDMRLFDITSTSDPHCCYNETTPRELEEKLTNGTWKLDNKENIEQKIVSTIKNTILNITDDTTIPYNNKTYKIGDGSITNNGTVIFNLKETEFWNNAKKVVKKIASKYEQPTITASELDKILHPEQTEK